MSEKLITELQILGVSYLIFLCFMYFFYSEIIGKYKNPLEFTVIFTAKAIKLMWITLFPIRALIRNIYQNTKVFIYKLLYRRTIEKDAFFVLEQYIEGTDLDYMEAHGIKNYRDFKKIRPVDMEKIIKRIEDLQ